MPESKKNNEQIIDFNPLMEKMLHLKIMSSSADVGGSGPIKPNDFKEIANLSFIDLQSMAIKLAKQDPSKDVKTIRRPQSLEEKAESNIADLFARLKRDEHKRLNSPQAVLEQLEKYIKRGTDAFVAVEYYKKDLEDLFARYEQFMRKIDPTDEDYKAYQLYTQLMAAAEGPQQQKAYIIKFPSELEAALKEFQSLYPDYFNFSELCANNPQAIANALNDFAALEPLFIQHIRYKEKNDVYELTFDRNAAIVAWTDWKKTRQLRDKPILLEHSDLGIKEKFATGKLSKGAWLTDLDIQRALSYLKLNEFTHVVQFDPIQIGHVLHLERVKHKKNEEYTVSFILNRGPADHININDRGLHWVHLSVNVRPGAKPEDDPEISCEYIDSLFLSKGDKENVEKVIRASLKYKDGRKEYGKEDKTVLEAFPNVENPNIIPPKGSQEQQDSFTCGYRALRQAIMAYILAGNAPTPEQEKITQCSTPEQFQEYIYTLLLSKTTFSEDEYVLLSLNPTYRGLLDAVGSDTKNYTISPDNVKALTRGLLHSKAATSKISQSLSPQTIEKIKTEIKIEEAISQDATYTEISKKIGRITDLNPTCEINLTEILAKENPLIFLRKVLDRIKNNGYINTLQLTITAAIASEHLDIIKYELDRLYSHIKIELLGDTKVTSVLDEDVNLITQRNTALVADLKRSATEGMNKTLTELTEELNEITEEIKPLELVYTKNLAEQQEEKDKDLEYKVPKEVNDTMIGLRREIGKRTLHKEQIQKQYDTRYNAENNVIRRLAKKERTLKHLNVWDHLFSFLLLSIPAEKTTTLSFFAGNRQRFGPKGLGKLFDYLNYQEDELRRSGLPYNILDLSNESSKNSLLNLITTQLESNTTYFPFEELRLSVFNEAGIYKRLIQLLDAANKKGVKQLSLQVNEVLLKGDLIDTLIKKISNDKTFDMSVIFVLPESVSPAIQHKLVDFYNSLESHQRELQANKRRVEAGDQASLDDAAISDNELGLIGKAIKGVGFNVKDLTIDIQMQEQQQQQQQQQVQTSSTGDVLTDEDALPEVYFPSFADDEELITYDTIASKLGDFIKEQGISFTPDDGTAKGCWNLIAGKYSNKFKYGIDAMTKSAAQYLITHLSDVQYGLKLDNLPQGFYLEQGEESPYNEVYPSVLKRKIILRYDPLRPRLNPNNSPLTLTFSEPMKSAKWLGDISQFIKDKKQIETLYNKYKVFFSDPKPTLEACRKNFFKLRESQNKPRLNAFYQELLEAMIHGLEPTKANDIIELLNNVFGGKNHLNNQNIAALAEILYAEGTYGLEKLLNELKGLKNNISPASFAIFKKNFIDPSLNLRELLDQKSIMAMHVLRHLKEDRRIWWDALTSQHCENKGLRDEQQYQVEEYNLKNSNHRIEAPKINPRPVSLPDLLSGFTYFCEELNELSPNIDFGSSCPLINVADMRLGLDCLLTILKNAQNFDEQFHALPGLSLNSLGPVYASQYDRYKLVTAEMQLVYRYFFPTPGTESRVAYSPETIFKQKKEAVLDRKHSEYVDYTTSLVTGPNGMPVKGSDGKDLRKYSYDYFLFAYFLRHIATFNHRKSVPEYKQLLNKLRNDVNKANLFNDEDKPDFDRIFLSFLAICGTGAKGIHFSNVDIEKLIEHLILFFSKMRTDPTSYNDVDLSRINVNQLFDFLLMPLAKSNATFTISDCNILLDALYVIPENLFKEDKNGKISWGNTVKEVLNIFKDIVVDNQVIKENIVSAVLSLNKNKNALNIVTFFDVLKPLLIEKETQENLIQKVPLDLLNKNRPRLSAFAMILALLDKAVFSDSADVKLILETLTPLIIKLESFFDDKSPELCNHFLRILSCIDAGSEALPSIAQFESVLDAMIAADNSIDEHDVLELVTGNIPKECNINLRTFLASSALKSTDFSIVLAKNTKQIIAAIKDDALLNIGLAAGGIDIEKKFEDISQINTILNQFLDEYKNDGTEEELTAEEEQALIDSKKHFSEDEDEDEEQKTNEELEGKYAQQLKELAENDSDDEQEVQRKANERNKIEKTIKKEAKQRLLEKENEKNRKEQENEKIEKRAARTGFNRLFSKIKNIMLRSYNAEIANELLMIKDTKANEDVTQFIIYTSNHPIKNEKIDKIEFMAEFMTALNSKKDLIQAFKALQLAWPSQFEAIMLFLNAPQQAVLIKNFSDIDLTKIIQACVQYGNKKEKFPMDVFTLLLTGGMDGNKLEILDRLLPDIRENDEDAVREIPAYNLKFAHYALLYENLTNRNEALSPTALEEKTFEQKCGDSFKSLLNCLILTASQKHGHGFSETDINLLVELIAQLDNISMKEDLLALLSAHPDCLTSINAVFSTGKNREESEALLFILLAANKKTPIGQSNPSVSTLVHDIVILMDSEQVKLSTTSLLKLKGVYELDEYPNLVDLRARLGDIYKNKITLDKTITDWQNQFDKEPFLNNPEKQRNFDDSNVIYLIEKMRNMTRAEPMPYAQREQLREWFTYVNDIGEKRAICVNPYAKTDYTFKSVREFSSDEITALLAHYREKIQDANLLPKEKEKILLEFIAIAREVMYRNARKVNDQGVFEKAGLFAKPAQIMALLVGMQRGADKNFMGQVKTGEGKTLIAGLEAAFLSFQGYTVDVATSNFILAGHGLETNQSFFNAMGIRSRMLSAADTDTTAYDYPGEIHYGTLADFALWNAKATAQVGDKFPKHPQKTALVLDEADAAALDDKTRYRFAKSFDPLTNPDESPYIWIYKAVIKFVNAERKGPNKSDKDYIAAAKRELLYAAQSTEEKKQLAEFMKPENEKDFLERLGGWLYNAGKSTDLLKAEGHAFKIHAIPHTRKSGEQISKACVYNSGIPNMSAEFSGFQHFLELQLAELYKEKLEKADPVTGKKMPPFLIGPEKTYITSLNSQLQINRYDYKYFTTGTAGSDPELQELAEKNNCDIIELAPNEKSNRKEFRPILTNPKYLPTDDSDKEEMAHINKVISKIVKILKKDGDKPIFVPCLNEKQAEKMQVALNKILEKNPKLKNKAPGINFHYENDTLTEKARTDAEKASVKEARKKGHITISKSAYLTNAEKEDQDHINLIIKFIIYSLKHDDEGLCAPILIQSVDQKQGEKIKLALDAALAKNNVLRAKTPQKVHAYYGSSKPTETERAAEEAEAIHKASAHGSITISNIFDRGTDFDPYHPTDPKIPPKAFKVVKAFIDPKPASSEGVKRKLGQGAGRTARQGKEGFFVLIGKRSELAPVYSEKELKQLKPKHSEELVEKLDTYENERAAPMRDKNQSFDKIKDLLSEEFYRSFITPIIEYEEASSTNLKHIRDNMLFELTKLYGVIDEQWLLYSTENNGVDLLAEFVADEWSKRIGQPSLTKTDKSTPAPKRFQDLFTGFCTDIKIEADSISRPEPAPLIALAMLETARRKHDVDKPYIKASERLQPLSKEEDISETVYCDYVSLYPAEILAAYDAPAAPVEPMSAIIAIEETQRGEIVHSADQHAEPTRSEDGDANITANTTVEKAERPISLNAENVTQEQKSSPVAPEVADTSNAPETGVKTNAKLITLRREGVNNNLAPLYLRLQTPANRSSLKDLLRKSTLCSSPIKNSRLSNEQIAEMVRAYLLFSYGAHMSGNSAGYDAAIRRYQTVIKWVLKAEDPTLLDTVIEAHTIHYKAVLAEKNADPSKNKAYLARFNVRTADLLKLKEKPAALTQDQAVSSKDKEVVALDNVFDGAKKETWANTRDKMVIDLRNYADGSLLSRGFVSSDRKQLARKIRQTLENVTDYSALLGQLFEHRKKLFIDDRGENRTLEAGLGGRLNRFIDDIHDKIFIHATDAELPTLLKLEFNDIHQVLSRFFEKRLTKDKEVAAFLTTIDSDKNSLEQRYEALQLLFAKLRFSAHLDPSFSAKMRLLGNYCHQKLSNLDLLFERLPNLKEKEGEAQKSTRLLTDAVVAGTLEFMKHLVTQKNSFFMESKRAVKPDTGGQLIRYRDYDIQRDFAAKGGTVQANITALLDSIERHIVDKSKNAATTVKFTNVKFTAAGNGKTEFELTISLSVNEKHANITLSFDKLDKLNHFPSCNVVYVDTAEPELKEGVQKKM
ncbi:MAG: hypothetical protein K2Q14_05960 [Gammaproteobacteria bacterium]|nr:hypothetical protein [Gammaproteobacteria bacterium]